MKYLTVRTISKTSQIAAQEVVSLVLRPTTLMSSLDQDPRLDKSEDKQAGHMSMDLPVDDHLLLMYGSNNTAKFTENQFDVWRPWPSSDYPLQTVGRPKRRDEPSPGLRAWTLRQTVKAQFTHQRTFMAHNYWKYTEYGGWMARMVLHNQAACTK